ncbi:hypothetical protein NL676_005057 [Syzygium grande]|nr:hypothetical protein NL676_005057 [Syzygium grande]
MYLTVPTAGVVLGFFRSLQAQNDLTLRSFQSRSNTLLASMSRRFVSALGSRLRARTVETPIGHVITDNVEVHQVPMPQLPQARGPGHELLDALLRKSNSQSSIDSANLALLMKVAKMATAQMKSAKALKDELNLIAKPLFLKLCANPVLFGVGKPTNMDSLMTCDKSRALDKSTALGFGRLGFTGPIVTFMTFMGHRAHPCSDSVAALEL